MVSCFTYAQAAGVDAISAKAGSDAENKPGFYVCSFWMLGLSFSRFWILALI